jgi:predicted nucleotidyltransferase component of viral defense system
MYWNTVKDLLRDSLFVLMRAKEFSGFRLVGGTSLSLQLGHRLSVDIDLFTDADYGSVDFGRIDAFLLSHFGYVDADFGSPAAMGKSYLIGTDRENNVKLDLYYSTDKFIQPALDTDGIRLATIEEIIAMKVDVVSRGGRKKDFWDLHELLPNYSIDQMLELHSKRTCYTHNREQILKNFSDFTQADDDFDPECLRGKYWEFIKEDIELALARKG